MVSMARLIVTTQRFVVFYGVYGPTNSDNSTILCFMVSMARLSDNSTTHVFYGVYGPTNSDNSTICGIGGLLPAAT